MHINSRYTFAGQLYDCPEAAAEAAVKAAGQPRHLRQYFYLEQALGGATLACAYIGIGRTTVWHMLRDGKEPSAAVVEKIDAVYRRHIEEKIREAGEAVQALVSLLSEPPPIPEQAPKNDPHK